LLICRIRNVLPITNVYAVAEFLRGLKNGLITFRNLDRCVSERVAGYAGFSFLDFEAAESSDFDVFTLP
jgi:hypothetical protein